MTPKEKAKKIVDMFFKITSIKDNLRDVLIDQKIAKESALLSVNLILQPFLIDYDLIDYWKEVKQEIEKI
jgi:hypothetical protein